MGNLLSQNGLSPFAQSIFSRTYSAHPQESWEECAARVAKAVAENDAQERQFFEIIRDRIFIPGGRYLYSAGRPIQQFMNCYGLVAEDSREGWGDLLRTCVICLSMGGGIGINYSSVRERGAPIRRMGGEASGPLALMQMVNETARYVMAGGKRRSALFGGLHWRHPDVHEFIRIKDWDDGLVEMKRKRFDAPAPLDMMNVSVIVDDEYFQLLRDGNVSVQALHQEICRRMVLTGEPGFLNLSRRLLDDPGAVTTNACTEACLHPYDTCDLGSIVMSRIRDLTHLEEVVRLGIQFLYNGIDRTIFPVPQTRDVAFRNRRLGLGVIGLHEYMLMRGHRYEWFAELDHFFSTLREVSHDEASRYAGARCGAIPIATNAIAPTGTISIIAESSSGVEPMFCVAYKRRYINNGHYRFQYVVDPTAKRMMEMGIPSKDLEDSYTLSTDLDRRLEVQTRVQDYIDQGISNTINTPGPGSVTPEAFSQLMRRWLPENKGITIYPHGSRPGQPLTPVLLEEAEAEVGKVYEEDGERCLNGVCGV